MEKEPKMIRQLPAVADRIETGPVKFGDDWPGLFIRGEECLWMAAGARMAQEMAKEADNTLLESDMKRLAGLLGQVDERLMLEGKEGQQ